ncbi:hypothetical protein [Pseudomonas syringae]|uniref:Uncharacterized protein n=1 Tax=Pseudomonas syringae TaxID=317 RepID=A0A085V485_PSESX|nr:hypothetical protein [Pseudomonas syringae]KFE50248.1 hypothetical protein IV02_17610 [Pseudomonas syringae]
MAYMTYSGPAEVVFELGEERSVAHDLAVSMEQTHTSTFRLVFIPDRPECLSCTAVSVVLPSGIVEYGPVTYRKSGVLVFYTGDEWGTPRGQP